MPTILVIAVKDSRLATLIGDKISAWLLPSGTDVEVRIIATEDEPEAAKVATLMMQLGYDKSEVEAAFPTIKLGWSNDEGETP